MDRGRLWAPVPVAAGSRGRGGEGDAYSHSRSRPFGLPRQATTITNALAPLGSSSFLSRSLYPPASSSASPFLNQGTTRRHRPIAPRPPENTMFTLGNPRSPHHISAPVLEPYYQPISPPFEWTPQGPRLRAYSLSEFKSDAPATESSDSPPPAPPPRRLLLPQHPGMHPASGPPRLPAIVTHPQDNVPPAEVPAIRIDDKTFLPTAQRVRRSAPPPPRHSPLPFSAPGPSRRGRTRLG